MTTIHVTIESDGLVVLWMDAPGKSVNTASPEFLADLSDIVSTLERDKPSGVVIASGKARSFCAGADLFELQKMIREQITEYLARGQALFERIAKLPMPTVAAINADCLGGGCELALACKYRVAADNPAISIGLPEVKLGLIPAWCGTTRLPRTIGLSKALPILLAGKTMPPRHALRVGLIDEVVRGAALLAAAKRIARTAPAMHQPSRMNQMAAAVPAVRHRILDSGRRRTQALSRGNYPAPMRLIDVIETGYAQSFAAGLEAERAAILDVSASAAGQNLMRLFFLKQGAKRVATQHITAQPHDVHYAGVIGGGAMGSGIVHALIRAGIPVRLVEVNPQAVSAALGRIQKLLDADVTAGRLDKLGARHAFNRVSPTVEWTGLELADFVIEAVVETMAAKREVFSKLDRGARPGAVLATNTSSLLVSDMAKVTLHPERVVGMHFFNPVQKMPLVEIVKAAHSDDASLATAIALAGRIGKTPIVVNDSPGFLVNRILIPCLAEAMLMASEGANISALDEAMKNWGMPMGPFELLDEIGLDVAAHVLDSLVGTGAPEALRQAVAALTHTAMERKFLGKKSGAGFYFYSEKKRATPAVNRELMVAIARASAPTEPAETIQWRLVLPMINEAARALSEHVTDRVDTIDLSTVLGLGLAPFRGGLIHFANAVGATELVRRMESAVQQYGPRFAPASMLRQSAASGRPLCDTPAPDGDAHGSAPQRVTAK